MQDNSTNNLNNTQGEDTSMSNPPVEPVVGETVPSVPDTNMVSDASMTSSMDVASGTPSSDVVATVEPVVTSAAEPVSTETTDQFSSTVPAAETPAEQAAPKKGSMTQVVMLVGIVVVLIALLGYYFLVMN